MMLKKKRNFPRILLLGSMFFFISGLWAQQLSKTYTGTVVDAKGDALIGVSVVVKGTNSGSITDVNGKFSIQTALQNPTIVLSYVGYETTELKPKTADIQQIELKETNKQLEDVVVVGYGTQRKKDLTGSVAVVKSSELKSLPVPSVSDALQGRAAGVQVISSGTPGSDAIFRIRGIGTINDANPLVVIDGFPIDGGLNQLNSDDIETIQVLKDASATAIYGSRGANGVIIITTKKGNSAKSQLNFTYSYAVQNATNLPKMLNGEQFATLHNEMLTNNGLSTNPAYADPSVFGVGTDWLGSFFQTAPMQNYSLNYSGGSEKSSVYVSGNYFSQDGIVINTGFKRFTFQINTDTKINSFLKFGNNITLNHDIKTSGNYSIRNAMLALPTQPIYRADGTFSGPVALPLYDGDLVNPVGAAKTVQNSTNGYNLMGSVFGELEIMKGLRFKSNFGLQANFWDSRTWSPKYTWDTSIQKESYLGEQYNKNLTWMWDNTLTYDKTIGKHKINVMVGTSAQETNTSYINGSIQGFASPNTQQLSNGNLPSTMTMGGSTSSYSMLSYIGRINYSFADKYLLTASLREDGSSRFGEQNKFGLFPSMSMGWRISEEDFFKSISFIDNMKIRAGYGATGNQSIGNYSFAAQLNTVYYNFNNKTVPAVAPTVIPNPFVQWEAQKQTNIGVDASMFGQRVEVILDAYLKNTEKMLVPMSVPAGTGYSDIFRPPFNAGQMENKGIELTINTKNLTGELKWNSSFNISYNVNKVISINDTIPMTSGSIGLNYNLALIKAGLPVNEFYGFVTDGIFQNQAEVDNHAVQVPGNDPYNRTSPGDIRFKDLNNDGVINDKDRTYLGNPNPTFSFALNNTFSYKGFDLSIFLQGVAGNKIINANRFWNEAMDVAQDQTIATLNRWTGEGTSNIMPRAVFNDPNKNTRPSDRYVEDGSYLRVKNVTLGYNLPVNLIKQIKISSARFYVSGQNLITFTKYSGFDPEVGTSGIDNNVYPVTRTISIGVNLGI